MDGGVPEDFSPENPWGCIDRLYETRSLGALEHMLSPPPLFGVRQDTSYARTGPKFVGTPTGELVSQRTSSADEAAGMVSWEKPSVRKYDKCAS